MISVSFSVLVGNQERGDGTLNQHVNTGRTLGCLDVCSLHWLRSVRATMTTRSFISQNSLYRTIFPPHPSVHFTASHRTIP